MATALKGVNCSKQAIIKRGTIADVNLSQELIEDMWLGVSVASQGRPGGRVLVRL